MNFIFVMIFILLIISPIAVHGRNISNDGSLNMISLMKPTVLINTSDFNESDQIYLNIKFIRTGIVDTTGLGWDLVTVKPSPDNGDYKFSWYRETPEYYNQKYDEKYEQYHKDRLFFFDIYNGEDKNSPKLDHDSFTVTSIHDYLKFNDDSQISDGYEVEVTNIDELIPYSLLEKQTLDASFELSSPELQHNGTYTINVWTKFNKEGTQHTFQIPPSEQQLEQKRQQEQQFIQDISQISPQTAQSKLDRTQNTISQIQSQIDSNTQQIDDNYDEIREHTKDRTKLQRDYDKKNETIYKLEDRGIAENKEKLDELEKELKEYNEQIAELNNQITQLESDNNELQLQITLEQENLQWHKGQLELINQGIKLRESQQESQETTPKEKQNIKPVEPKKQELDSESSPIETQVEPEPQIQPDPEPKLIKNIPEPQPQNPLPIAPFVDPDRDPYHYINRYHIEPSYKEWFERNYPQYDTIFQAVGMTEDEINYDIIMDPEPTEGDGWTCTGSHCIAPEDGKSHVEPEPFFEKESPPEPQQNQRRSLIWEFFANLFGWS